MDPKVRSKINRIAAEANAIARELEDISNGSSAMSSRASVL
ncbi:hypothetical protein LC048_24315 [Mesobacillus subterraneus]|nr:hypothetical protein [Mesobacillus subterraneus]WLR55348.1 hypothetical protein LC048_24315 [Mesobacillus subterraneus]